MSLYSGPSPSSPSLRGRWALLAFALPLVYYALAIFKLLGEWASWLLQLAVRAWPS